MRGKRPRDEVFHLLLFFVSFFYFKNIEADFGEGSRICKAIPMTEIFLIKKIAR